MELLEVVGLQEFADVLPKYLVADSNKELPLQELFLYFPNCLF
jgi:hypothetical protein